MNHAPRTLKHILGGIPRMAAAALLAARAAAGADCVPETLSQTLSEPSPAALDKYGFAVALSGSRAVIGASSATAGAYQQAGRAFLVDAATGATVAELVDPNQGKLRYFGAGVGISGNLAVVGSPGFGYPAHSYNATTATHVATMTSPNPSTAGFGGRISVSGNLALISANTCTVGGVVQAGEAYVFDATTGALKSTLNIPSPQANDFFGSSVAIEGNLAAVGAPSRKVDGLGSAGAVYVFNAQTGALIRTLTDPYQAYAPNYGDRFGASVALSGNLLAVGSDFDESYVFNATTGALISRLAVPSIDDFSGFGGAISISGNRVAVGASRKNSPYSDLSDGYAALFTATTGELLATVQENLLPNDFDNFGRAVALSGDRLLVGAPGSKGNLPVQGGQAFVYTCPPVTPSPTPTPSPTITRTPTVTPTATPPCFFSIPQQGAANPYPATFLAEAAPTNLARVVVEINGLTHTFPSDLDIVLVGPGGQSAVLMSNAGVGAVDNVNLTFNDAARYAIPAQAQLVSGSYKPTSNGAPSLPGPAPAGPYGTALSVFNGTNANGLWKLYVNDHAAGDAGCIDEWALSFLAATPTPTPSATPSPTPTETPSEVDSTCAPGSAQATLSDPIPSADASFGQAIAVSGGVAVVGAPLSDHAGATNAGAFSVIDALTGEAREFYDNYEPGTDDHFGQSVAVSGDLAVIGSPGHDVAGNPAPIADAGRAYVYNIGSSDLVAILANPNPAAGDEFGYSVAISGNLAVVGAWKADPAGVTDAGAAYLFDATTGALLRTLANPAPAVEDYFGQAVAISGGLVVVGAYGDDGTLGDAGAAYVFRASTGALLATLENPSPSTSDYFGFSVAISGELAVIGSRLLNIGTAYVFHAPSGNFLNELLDPEPEGTDQFGASLAISGRFAVVGARADAASATLNAGTAYVFDAATGEFQATLNNPAAAQDDAFGAAVAISGNVAVIGAPGDDATAANAGAAYSFSCVAPSPTASPTPTPSPTETPVPACAPDTFQATLNHPIPSAGSAFGAAVAVSGGRAVVGAPTDDHAGAVNAGAFYVLDPATGDPIEAYDNPTAAAEDRFGQAVGLSGTNAVIGAPGDDASGTNAGTAYVYEIANGDLLSTLNNPAPGADDAFGSAVAVDGNLVVVGAPTDDPGGIANAGTVYLFDGSTGQLLMTINNPAPAADDLFGASVGISEGLIVVGAYGDDGTLGDAGAAYIFDAGSGALVAELANPSPSTSDYFGLSAAISGNLAVVGSRVLNGGTAYVYFAPTGMLVGELLNPEPEVSDAFGSSVAISGVTAVIGAKGDSTGGSAGTGRAYVFDAAGSLLLAKLINPSPTQDDAFGSSVAISGAVAVIGAPGDDATAADGGTAYSFSCQAEAGTPTPTPGPDRRAFGDFDGSGCTDLSDFLFLLDNWQAVPPGGGEAVGLADFLNLLDNWQIGPGCV